VAFFFKTATKVPRSDHTGMLAVTEFSRIVISPSVLTLPGDLAAEV
jgi:hypothetical protein